MDVSMNSMGGNFSQCKCLLNHHIVLYKYLTILLVNNTTIKLRKSLPTLGNGGKNSQRQAICTASDDPNLCDLPNMMNWNLGS